MTRADREAIAKYLRDFAGQLRADYYDPRTKRVEPKEIRDDETARLNQAVQNAEGDL